MSETNLFPGMQNEGQDDDSLQANSVLFDRYKILGVIGGGGMGTVYQALDLKFPETKRFVAVKEMLPATRDAALRSSSLKIFQREANILATLSHPAIPTIFDYFVDNERAYLVMEFINGKDLETLLKQAKELPIKLVIEWAIDLCDVLHYLHSHDPSPIVFRDMKPANVMIDSLGKVRLIDFGIAKTFDGAKGTAIGTEGYSAMEQYRGEVTPRSDIYSLGATLHHVLTRRDPRLEVPFTFHERPIKDLNPKVPDELVRIIEKALDVEGGKRYTSCAEMKADLERLLQPQQPAEIMPPPSHTLNGTDWGLKGIDAGIQPIWAFKAEDELRGGPVVVDNLVLVGSYDTNMWAVDIQTGEIVWKVPTHGGISATPALHLASNSVLFGSADHHFYSLDYRNGREHWKFKADGPIRASAFVAHDYVFFGSDDGHVYALNISNGRKSWAHDTGAPVRGRPFVTDDMVVIGTELNEVLGLELSGKRKWSYRGAKKSIISSPVVDAKEGICYIGSYDNSLHAIDASRGFPSWRYRAKGAVISSPALGQGLVIFGSTDGELYALNTSNNGREKWKFETEKPIVAPPVIHRHSVYFGGTDGIFYCLDLETGKKRWDFKTENAITSAPAITDKLILVSSMDHTLYALPYVE